MGDISWKFPRHLAVVFTLLCGGVLALSYFYYEHHVASYYREQETQLNTVADLKVKTLVNWRYERLDVDGMTPVEALLKLKELREKLTRER